MASGHVPAAVFKLATSADLRPVALRLKQLGAEWADLPLITELWDAGDSGPRFYELREYRTGFGALVSLKSGTLGGFRLERENDSNGRSYIARYYCVIPRDEASRFTWDFGLLRSFWGGALSAETSVVELSVDLPSERQRQTQLAALAQDRPWLDLFTGLLQAIAQEWLPIAVAPGVLPPEAVPTIAEAIQLVLPPGWRSRFSFASGLCDGEASAVHVRFMALPHGLQRVRLLRAAQTPQLGEPTRDYARLVRDALADCWLDSLMDEVRRVERAGMSSAELVRETAAQVWFRYGWQPLQDALLAVDGLQDVTALLLSLERPAAPSLDLPEVCDDSFWQRVAALADWSVVLPNCAALRDWLGRKEGQEGAGAGQAAQRELDQRLRTLLEQDVAGRSVTDGWERVERLTAKYPWPDDVILAVLASLSQPAADPVSAGRVLSSIMSLDARRPSLVDRLLQWADQTTVTGMLSVLVEWLRNHRVQEISDRTDLVEVGNQRWIVKKLPQATAVAARYTSLDAPIEGILPCSLRVVAPDGRRLWTIRPYVEGTSLGQGRSWQEAELLSRLEGVALALDALHKHGAYHGNLKPTNVFLYGQGVLLVDEAAEAFSAPPSFGKQWRDRRDFAEMVVSLLQHKDYCVTEQTRSSILRLADLETALQLLKEAQDMIEKDAVQQILTELVKDSNVREEIVGQVRQEISQVAGDIRSIDAKVGESIRAAREFEERITRRIEDLEQRRGGDAAMRNTQQVWSSTESAETVLQSQVVYRMDRLDQDVARLNQAVAELRSGRGTLGAAGSEPRAGAAASPTMPRYPSETTAGPTPGTGQRVYGTTSSTTRVPPPAHQQRGTRGSSSGWDDVTLSRRAVQLYLVLVAVLILAIVALAVLLYLSRS